MKTEIPLAIIMNVPRKSAQPVFAESRPEQQPDACDNQATNKNESAQVVHGSWNKITLRSGFSTPTHCLAVICAGEPPIRVFVERWISGVWCSDGSGTGVSPVCQLHGSHGRDAAGRSCHYPGCASAVFARDLSPMP